MRIILVDSNQPLIDDYLRASEIKWKIVSQWIIDDATKISGPLL